MAYDVIRVKNLELMVAFSDGAQWPSEKPKVQPVYFTITIPHDVSQSAEKDDLRFSINYSTICRTITQACENTVFASTEFLCDAVLERCFEAHDVIGGIELLVCRPRALLHPASTSVRVSRSRNQVRPPPLQFTLSNLEVRTIVGVNTCEREERQLVRADVTFFLNNHLPSAFDFRAVSRDLSEVSD